MDNTQWYAKRPFKGIDLKGNTRAFVPGDLVPNVQEWPTFSSLKNIDWITATPPSFATASTRKNGATVVQPLVTKVEVEEKTQEDSELLETKSVEEGTLQCDQCDKEFKSSRALKVHMRYH